MTRFANNVKTALLMGGMMGLFLAVGSIYGQNGMILALIFGTLMNFGVWFFSDRIAIATMGGKIVGPDEVGLPGELYHIVDELRQRANLPMPRVFICPHQAPNAFATGRSPSKAAVAVTAGALELLSLDELRGVIAHELAHVKNRDTLTSAIAATVAGVLATVARFSLFFGGGRRDENSNPLVGLLTIILAAVGAVVIQAMISRSREYVADADGAKIAGSPRGLIGALQKLELQSKRVPLQSMNPAQNSMFIVKPLSGSSIFNIFSTHPPMEKRIAALEGLGREMEAYGPRAAW